jgi:hypothetical protein
MRSKSILYGVNVPISPTSTSETTLTNNITISTNSPYPSLETIDKETEKMTDCVEDTNKENVSREIEGLSPASPKGSIGEVKQINEQLKVSSQEDAFSDYILKLYQAILLSDNKKLLANAIFKDSIILTQEDLEHIIELKINQKCTILYEDPEIFCCGKNSPIMKISSIRVNGSEPSDFKIVYNKEYLELITKYHLNLKYVLVN